MVGSHKRMVKVVVSILLILGALCLAWQRDTFEKSKQHALKGQKYIAQGNALGI